jgi:hypothetical protein
VEPIHSERPRETALVSVFDGVLTDDLHRRDVDW